MRPMSSTPVFPRFNVIGLRTLIRREVERFLTVYSQTIVAPVITTMLYYAIFALAFGGRIAPEVHGAPFLQFLAPGLIMMAMVQNAFSNTSSSIIIAKVQGNIVDILMPPLSSLELMVGFLAGSLIRGLTLGLVLTIIMNFFVPMGLRSLFDVFSFAILGNLMLASLGMIAGIWSEKFDHMAAITNFIVTPLTFLSGTFYAMESLPPVWQKVAAYNPFFYMIDGFRYGFIGGSDSHIWTGLIILVAVNAALITLAWSMLQTGYKIKS